MQAFFAKKAEDGGEVMVRVKRKEKLNKRGERADPIDNSGL